MNILLNIEPHALIADSGLGLVPVIVAIVAVFLFVAYSPDVRRCQECL